MFAIEAQKRSRLTAASIPKRIDTTADRKSESEHNYNWDTLSLSMAGAQPKLAVSQPGDLYEGEANRIADQITARPESKSESACPCGNSCSECQGKGANEGPEPAQLGEHDIGVAPPLVKEALSSGGQPLSPPSRALMEAHFGYDFSHVRVHSDREAAESARAANAMAYTVGRHVVFGAGAYQPETNAGRKLLAHELTHTVQQTQGTGAAAAIL